MRETFLIGSAVFIGVAGAVISSLPVIAWLRTRRRRNAVYASFLHAYGREQLRARRFSREKAIDGEGFIDRVIGTAGAAPFTLSRRFRPFRSVDAFWLHVDGETFVFNLDVSKDDRHPIVQSYLQLRRESSRDSPPPEAN
jgi:predicted Zn-dependent protease